MSLLSRLPRDAARLVYTRNCPRYYSAIRAASRNERLAKYVQVSEEVQGAIGRKEPVVALESAIITHGLPSPDNVELAAEVEAVVRENGAIPATIAVVNGVARVGLGRQMMESLGSGMKSTIKVSRRDLPYIAGLGLQSGGTTVAGTMLLANMAGIKIFATGGIGGVHRGAANTQDISADLTELGRTNVAVVCSGPKPFLDLERTIEYLETAGVPVMTFGTKGDDKVWVPGFYSRDSLVLSPLVVDSVRDAASIIYASHSLGLKNGQLFCNPIPKEYHIARLSMHSTITGAVKRATKRGITGKEITPFILDFIRRETGGMSVEANKALVLNNAKQAAKIAVQLSKLEGGQGFLPTIVFKSEPEPEASAADAADEVGPHKPNLIVIGSIAVDLSCDAANAVSLHTSNPSRITETLGGVGNNVATAAHYVGARVRLVSAVGQDLSGDWAMERIKGHGLDPIGIQMIEGKSTSRYVAVNGSDGELSVASADMSIIEDIDLAWLEAQLKSKPEWVCVDGNLNPETIQKVIKTSNKAGIKVAFEPTSKEKSTRILSPNMKVYPNSNVELSAPNELELASMFDAAKEMGLFEKKEWFEIIDAINVESMFLNKIEMLGHESKVDFSTTGLIQQAIHLSPYFPNQLIKLGAKGVLSVRIIGADDPLPIMPNAIMTSGTGPIRGIIVSYFPAETPQEIVSVNGVGDTFFGVVLGGLSKSKSWDRYADYIAEAQKAACLTLASRESVSPGVRRGKDKSKRMPAFHYEPGRSSLPHSQIVKPMFDGKSNIGR